jgi:hypothetical protein
LPFLVSMDVNDDRDNLKGKSPYKALVIDPVPAFAVPNDDPCVTDRRRVQRGGSRLASHLCGRTSLAMQERPLASISLIACGMVPDIHRRAPSFRSAGQCRPYAASCGRLSGIISANLCMIFIMALLRNGPSLGGSWGHILWERHVSVGAIPTRFRNS